MHRLRYSPWGKAKSIYYNGLKFDSKFEADYAHRLDLLKMAGEVKSWQTHVTIPLRVNGELITNYKIDFVVEKTDGTVEYVETKGYLDACGNLRWKLFQAIVPEIFPGAKCVMVMQQPLWPKRHFRRRKFL